ncbi:MAG: hypothetical protein MUC49_02330 [Raineya sp.]|jgi:hypothetical protein|nr:hypothetical protein [Raineya sp.]
MQKPNLTSTASYWIQWHQSLENDLGLKNANTVFLDWWSRYGQTGDGNDATLREYLKRKGVALEGEYGPLSSISDTWQSANTGFKKIGSTAMIGVFLLILMLIGAVYFLFIKKD